MPTPPTYLGDTAAAVLAAAVAGIEAAGLEAPERRYVEAGPAVAWDCEEVVVHLPNFGTGRARKATATDGRLTRSTTGTGPVLLTADFIVDLVLCVPKVDTDEGGHRVNLPDPADITAASQRLLNMGRAAWQGVYAAARAKTLIPADQLNRPGSSVEVADATTRGPEGGGFAGIRFTVSAPA